MISLFFFAIVTSILYNVFFLLDTMYFVNDLQHEIKRTRFLYALFQIVT
jgi:hypothetical protein